MKLILYFLLLLSYFSLHSQTNIPGGNVFDTWNKSSYFCEHLMGARGAQADAWSCAAQSRIHLRTCGSDWSGNVVRVAAEKGVTNVFDNVEGKDPFELITNHLSNGKPIRIGVANTAKFNPNSSYGWITDHFIVVVASGKDSKGVFIEIYDQGNKSIAGQHRLYKNDQGLWTKSNPFAGSRFLGLIGGPKYTLVEVFQTYLELKKK